MQGYRLHRGWGPAGLELADLDAPSVVNDDDVLVRIRAVSLNHRDLSKSHAAGDQAPLTPCSDAAGEVIAIGKAVTRFGIGDRVAASFFPHWIDGPPTPEKTTDALGGRGPGVLCETLCLPEHSWFHIPESLDCAQAATLPCAGVTAWNALFEAGASRPGDTVLLLGTGGVSIWALQLAKAAGLKVILLSSDDRKLRVARELGADATLNYRAEPDWAPRVRALTGGRGVDLVIETGGRATLARSMTATRHAGTLAVIGGLSGWGGEVDADALVDGALRVQGVLVGSRAMAEDLVRFVDRACLRPVIDRRFGFEDAREAYEYLATGAHVGKVVVDVSRPVSDRRLAATGSRTQSLAALGRAAP